MRVAVTGAAGQIGYSLLFRIASGEMLGKDQPVILQLLDLPQAQKAGKGVMMELEDCAFPLLAGMIATDDPNVAFKDVRVLVVGNPCNTNAYIARAAAIKVGRTNPNNYHGMLRLDHNRALSQLAAKSGREVSSLKKMVVWGNHSPSMYADYRFCESNGDSVKALINDHAWNNDVFLPTVGKRGAAIIEARGLSSAASAANAAIAHVHDWVLGSSDWVTMGVPSDGSYGIPEGIVFGFPCECKDGQFKIIQGLEIDEYSQGKINATLKELEEERAAVADMLK